ncbi:MAG: hypothetical protein A2600_12345 [Candidatus Lambdaproteobacteria bacterium RIFOXYD1_FULL_56_27]|uniref:ATP-grasp fold RimK-type domain-containing protein n=1 Tax=Candidatus Lambdaproteobacteria bacterium RIFOXYD2_FULL_56_26 TaxID=1817773 RepID=A0A1F6H207_9PROT|nr:MAG: hypothetical protein A2426_12465 [Candidatus Lambdaproteobacteria bacterium RIFOXYC1_FULL_56_13]OGH04376.1 MAG: hypothetical protein A2557_11045 [Candidatus Lambdaproteobacteria bacterium RIFOXYD2_FULL_56_26]OGH08159.1 MAG: hypothetical protein A2600_12345 [Candidatus Lambdaproteobacteria bacterium RIFOXYD1_FULL_56_27]
MKPQVLLLTGIYDFSADLVAVQLRSDGIPFLRLNREQMHEFRFELDAATPRLHVVEPESGNSWFIDNELVSVWFRQPVFLRNTPSMPLSPEEQLSRSQWMGFLRAMCVFDNARWMNWPQATYLAESKPYQLLVAGRCGFALPPTSIGNVLPSAFREAKKEQILKSVDSVLLKDGQDCLFTFSTQVEPALLQTQQLTQVPFILQEYVADKTDIRVTVIGKKIFAVKILSKGKPIQGDWRITKKDQLEYTDFSLPLSVEKACFELTSILGLNYSAIDLLETKDGFIFLEVNPTGEWGWLKSDSRPLDREIASWLSLKQ